jgi:hypothetical protein
MTSPRTALLLLVAATLAIGPADQPADSPAAAGLAWPPPGPAGHAEPMAPVQITLTTAPGPNGLIDLDYAVSPRLDAAWVTAEVELSHGGRLIEQQAPQLGATARGATAGGRATIELPEAVRAGRQSAELRVVAHVGLAQPDGTIETLGAEAVAVVGEGPLPVDARLVSGGGLLTRDVSARHVSADAPASASQSAGGMVVSGEFRYVDREFTWAQGWTGNKPELPIRLARVLVLDAATEELLAEGATDLEGSYAIAVSGSGSRDLLVRCLSFTDQLAPESVVVEIVEDQPYSVSSPVFADWDLATDLDAGLTVAEEVFSGNQQGNPFNLLDMAVDGFRYVASLGLPPSTEPLAILWPTGGGSSYGSLATLWMSTGQGYDDMVTLHELGHSIDFRYSEPDTNGGSHYFGESDQFPSLSLSEGFATFFGGAVRQFIGAPNPGFYFNGKGNSTTGPASILLRMEFETRKPYVSQTGGEADEVAVCAALWNLVDTAATDDGDGVDDDPVDGSFLFGDRWTGDQLIFHTLRAETVMTADSVNVIDLWDGFFLDAGVDRYEELADAFEESEIAVRPDAAEPDDGPEQAVTIVADSGWSPVRTLVASRTWPPVPGKGDEDHIVFDLPADTVFEVKTRYPGGKADAETYADTYLIVEDPWGQYLGASDYGGAGANARVVLATGAAGSYRATVRSFNPSQRTGRYEVRVRTVGPVTAPVITAVTPPEVVNLSDGWLISLIIEGENFHGTQRVAVGGVSSSGFSVSGGEQIVATMPLVQTLGVQDVVVTNAAGEARFPINVVAADPPAINVNFGSLYWSHDLIKVKMGAEPGDLMWLWLSFSDEPTSIPGVVDLGIGAGGSDLLLIDAVTLSGGGTGELGFRRPDEIPALTHLYMQGAVQRASDPTGALVPTNVEPGILLP